MDFLKMKQGDAARAIGVARQTLAAWTKRGAPRNPDGTYSLPDVFGWCIEEAKAAPEEASTPEADMWLTEFRKQRALMARLQREAYEGSLIQRDDVERLFADRAHEFGRALLYFGRRVGAQLAAETGEKLKRVIEICDLEAKAILNGYTRRPIDPGGPQNANGKG